MYKSDEIKAFEKAVRTKLASVATATPAVRQKVMADFLDRYLKKKVIIDYVYPTVEEVEGVDGKELRVLAMLPSPGNPDQDADGEPIGRFFAYSVKL